jgi:AAA-ATPase Vps4-associated protein 1
LKDRGFCTPVVDEKEEANKAAAAKKEELDKEIERVKKEYLEKQKRKKEKAKEKDDDKKDDKDDKDDEDTKEGGSKKKDAKGDEKVDQSRSVYSRWTQLTLTLYSRLHRRSQSRRSFPESIICRSEEAT